MAIETSILRDIGMSRRLEKAGAMVAIKVGLALDAAKDMIRGRCYEAWVEEKFGSAFGKRRARDFRGLAVAFRSSAEAKTLELPPLRDRGNWLVRSDDGSELCNAVSTFIGDLNTTELLEKHGIKAPKKKGGYHPKEEYVLLYQQEHPDLKGVAFEEWAAEDRQDFMEWQAREVGEDDGAAVGMTAGVTWRRLAGELAEHGLSRKSWCYLDAADLENVVDVLRSVAGEMAKALKGGGKGA